MMMMMIIAAPPLPLAKFSSNHATRKPPSSSSSSSSSSVAALTSFSSIRFSYPFASLSIAPLGLRKKFDSWTLLCTKKEEGQSAHDLFDGFSVLSSDIPWNSDNLWSTFAAYFFILHIPLSFGGLSVTAHILYLSVLDPLTMALSAVLLQTVETVGAMSLLYFTAKPEYRFLSFIKGMLTSEQRSWIKGSSLGLVFLLGLVLLSSAIADRIIGPKDVNNSILKDMLSYSPASETACFLLYCLVAPLLEEAMYRGFLLTSLASRMKWWQAVGISSCIFSLAHFSGENSLQLFLIGCVLGSVYCWTGNLFASFTVHSVYNATILLVTASQSLSGA